MSPSEIKCFPVCTSLWVPIPAQQKQAGKNIFLGLAWNGFSPAAASLELRETFCFPPTGLGLQVWRADLAKGRCLVTANPGCQCGPAAVHSLTSPSWTSLSQPDTYSTGWKSCGEMPGEGRQAVWPVGGVRGEQGGGGVQSLL